MVKITPDNVGAKVGKLVNPRTCVSLCIVDKHVDDISGSWERFVSLTEIDLSKNWLQFTRQMQAVFAVPKLESLDLRGNALCKTKDYRLTIVGMCPQLSVLDGEPVTDAERGEAMALMREKEGGAAAAPAVDLAAERKRQEELAAAKAADAKEREVRAAQLREQQMLREKASRVHQDEVARLLAGEAQEQESSEGESREGVIAEVAAERSARAGAAKAEEEEEEARRQAAQQAAEAEALITQQVAAEKAAAEKATAAAVAATATSAAIAADAVRKPSGATAGKTQRVNKTTKDHSTGETTFVDRRTNMVISDKLSARADLKVTSSPKKAAPKRNLFGENDLFGEEKTVDFDDGTAEAVASLGLGGQDDDFLSAIDASTQKREAAVKASTALNTAATSLFGDDDNGLFSTGSFSAPPASATDDLFSMFGAGNNTATGAAPTTDSGIDISAYIAKNSGSGSGGLFGDD